MDTEQLIALCNVTLPPPHVPPMELYYRTLLEATLDAVFLVDCAGRFREVNPAGCRLLGYSPDEFATMTVPEILALAGSVWKEFPTLVGGCAAHLDQHLRRKDGSIVHVDLQITPLPVLGTALYYLICRDRTERDALEILRRRERLLYWATIRSLAATVDARDAYTHAHSQQVSLHSRRIAQALHLPPAEVETIALAGLLHDIGKLAIPDAILRKPGRLSAEEWALMRTHAVKGAAILSAGSNMLLAPIVPLVRHHHEHWDGTGYPDALQGAAIPLGAAVIAIADCFDTMTSIRPYKAALGVEAAWAEIRRNAGTQFHPEVVSALQPEQLM